MKVSCAAFAREKKEKSQTQKALSIERESLPFRQLNRTSLSFVLTSRILFARSVQ